MEHFPQAAAGALCLRHIDRAIALALPDRLYGLLAEYCRTLDTLLENRLSAADPAAWDNVKRLYHVYNAGWSKLSGSVRGRNLITTLTKKGTGGSQTGSFAVTVTGAEAIVENQASVLEGKNTFKTNIVTNELYQIEDIAVDITAKKTVKNTGSEKIGPKGFSFELLNVASGEKITGKSDKDGLVVYGLTFTEADVGKTYTYKLSEINDGKANVTYSTAIHAIAITVTESADHKLVASITHNGAAVKAAVAEFENVYNYTPAAAVNPYTGDTMNVALWAALLLISALGMIALPVAKKRMVK